jgi:hypothetical protein
MEKKKGQLPPPAVAAHYSPTKRSFPVSIATCCMMLSFFSFLKDRDLWSLSPKGKSLLSRNDFFFGKPQKPPKVIVQLHNRNYIQHLPSSQLLSTQNAAKTDDLSDRLTQVDSNRLTHFQPAYTGE